MAQRVQLTARDYENGRDVLVSSSPTGAIMMASAEGGNGSSSDSYLPVEYRMIGEEDIYLSGVFTKGKLFDQTLQTEVTIGPNPGNAIANSIRAAQPPFDIASNWTQTIVLAEFDDEEVQPLTGDYPDPDDPRWVDIEFPFPCRTIYINFSDWEMQNLLSAAGASWYIYANIDENIIRINSDLGLTTRTVRNNGSFSVQLPTAYQKQNFRLLLEFVGSALSQINTGLIIRNGGISVAAGQQVLATAIGPTPTKIRVNYDLNGSITQGGYQGIQGSITDFNPVTNNLSFNWGDYVPPVGSKVKFISTVTGAVAPAGISVVIEPKTVNFANNTCVVRASYVPQAGKFYRFATLSGTASGITSGAIIGFSSVVPLGGDKYLCTLTRDGLAVFYDRGSVTSNRYVYLSPVESQEFTLISGNRISSDGTNPIELFCEYQATGNFTAGVASVITFADADHGFNVGDLVEFGLASLTGAAYPGGITTSATCFFVLRVNANAVVVSQTAGGAPAVFTSTGTGVTVEHPNGQIFPVSVSAGTSSVWQVGAHGLPVGAKIWMLGGTIPASLRTDRPYYLSTVTANTGQVTVADIPGGVPIATEAATSSIQIGITNTTTGNTPAMIGLAEYWLKRGSKSSDFDILPSENGDPLVVATTNAAAISIAAVDPVKVSCKVAIAGFR